MPSARRRWYSGSASSGIPLHATDSTPSVTPTKVAGIVTIIISMSPTSMPDKEAISATVAADTGEAIRPCWAAMTLMDMGRSGRTPALRETSAITGSRE